MRTHLNTCAFDNKQCTYFGNRKAHCKTPALLQKTERPKPTTHAPPDTTPVYNASTWDEDLDKQNVQVTNGERDCTSWCYWVAPTWVWGEGHWWPVIKTSTPQFLKYCFCSPIDQRCTHFLPNNFQDPFRSPVSVCSRCSTDWAWRRVWVWDDGNCDAHQRWLKVPSGCYCTLLHAEYCLSTDIHYPWDYRLPNLETTDEDEGS
ncbi:uncharacterized protein LOC106166289 isoform X2 [Lingula anatina]|uniref:Uncharacterized protein LOC106166289 isoform X2 n=1 Tax=Lingula anatina TaxID=7574 RepID=A0A1S3IPU9_LINAN|nr:uncharacterized protein LOC106166289 isoform X2 [Lingula anatina]|eukprot:XP_013400250.1 uncharacterized protein LOC106166289 isoform X2 [Lingula anatina]